VNAAEIVYARLLLEQRSEEAPFGLRLLARIEQAWRAGQAEREQERAARVPYDELQQLES
jgi:hypothetical protein